MSTRKSTTAGRAGESGFLTKTAETEAGSTEPEAGGQEPAAGSRKAATVAVADRLHSAAIQLLRRVRKQDIATGEGPARLSALSVVVFGGPKTLKELAAAEQVKPPTMSRIVAGLARSRLIQVEPDPVDRRRRRIHATVKGRQILEKGRRLRIADLAQLLDRLSAQELSQLSEAVEILARLLKNRG
jgi:DNA-binding MarR family transcriptional regulator